MFDRIENKSKFFKYLLAIYFMFSPLDYILPHFGEATVMLVVGLLISALAAFMAFGHEYVKLENDQICIFLLMMMMVASNFWAIDGARAFSYTFSFVATAAMYFLLLFFKFSKDEIELFETAFIIGGTIFILYVFTQIDLSKIMDGYRLNLKRIGNEEYFADPNGLAARLMMPLILMIKRIFERKSKGLKVLYVGLAGTMTYIILLTGSRASVLSMGAMIGVLLLTLGNKRWGTIFVIGLIALGVILLMPDILPEHIVNRVFNLEKYTEITTAEGDRIDIWKNVIVNVFPIAPFFGHGAGNASVSLIEHYGYAKSVHSSWFTMLADLGIIGFVLWMSLIFGKMKQAFILRKNNAYVLAVLVAVLLMSSTLDAVNEKYLWNSFLYVHLITVMYVSKDEIIQKIK